MATEPKTYNEYSWVGEICGENLKATCPDLGITVEAKAGPEGAVGVPLHEAMEKAFNSLVQVV